MMRNIAALQLQPAPGPRRGQVVQRARCSTGTLLYLVTPPEDASMMSSQVNILLNGTQNTRVKTYVLNGVTKVGTKVCQGVNICPGDEEVCGPQLRCNEKYVTKYNMSTIPVRSYCYGDDDYIRIKKNGSYDLVDRSDEDLSVSSAQSTNYTALAQCTQSDGDGMRVSRVMGSACTLLTGVMTRRR